jgi:hypothetical protein
VRGVDHLGAQFSEERVECVIVIVDYFPPDLCLDVEVLTPQERGFRVRVDLSGERVERLDENSVLRSNPALPKEMIDEPMGRKIVARIERL